MKYPITLLISLLLTSGCIPTKPDTETELQESSPDTPSPDQLVNELTILLKDPKANNTTNHPYQIASELSKTNPETLSSIIDILGQPDTTDQTKIFILQVINPYITEAHFNSIEPLLDSQSPVTRSCATNLLGSISSPEVTRLLTQLRDDSNPAVSFSAWSGLALQGQEPHRKEFIQNFTNSKTTPSQKFEIVRILLANPQLDDLPTLAHAINDPKIDPSLRRIIALALGDLGTIQSIEPLQQSMQLETAQDYKQIAETAITAIQQRNKA